MENSPVGHSGCQLLPHLEGKDLQTPSKASGPGFRNRQSNLPEHSLRLPAHHPAHSSRPSHLMAASGRAEQRFKSSTGVCAYQSPTAHSTIFREGFAGPEDRPSGVRRRPATWELGIEKGPQQPALHCALPQESLLSRQETTSEGCEGLLTLPSCHVDWPRWQRQA